MTVRDYSTTAADNDAAPPNGAPEGCAASTINDIIRQIMAEVRDSFEEQPYFDWGDDPTRVDNDTFTVAGDLTARYPVGYVVKLVGATTGYGVITASAHAAGTTTIDVTMDSGNVPTSLVRVAVATQASSSNVLKSRGLEVGYRELPQDVKTGNYTFVDADRGRLISSTTTGGHTFTVPASTITTNGLIMVQNAGSASLAIGVSGVTLYWINGGGSIPTGARTLAVGGECTLHFTSTTDVTIRGVGLS